MRYTDHARLYYYQGHLQIIQEYYRMFTLFFQNFRINQRSQKRVKSINISYCINHWQASNLNSHVLKRLFTCNIHIGIRINNKEL